MAGRPSLLDNLHADTGHGDSLVYLTKDLDDRHELSVATGYVNLGGLHHVAVSVDEDRATRLLLGAAPSSGLGGEFPATLFERSLLALCKERDLARFPKSRALQEAAGHPGLARPPQRGCPPLRQEVPAREGVSVR